jgi:FKBP-type peptidyl-prolyl cis-trans isomerase (trigger factor)
MLSEARKRVKDFLVLRAIAEKENIQVLDEEAAGEMKRISKNYPNIGNLAPEQLKEYTKEVIRHEKIFQLLESFVKP